MSFDELENIVNEYNKKFINDWEQTRFLSYVNVLIGGSKIKSPKDLIKFSWEQDDEIVDQSKEELEIIQANLLELTRKQDWKSIDLKKL